MATFTEFDAIIDNAIIDLTAALNPSTGDIDASNTEREMGRRLLKRLQLIQRTYDREGFAS